MNPISLISASPYALAAKLAAVLTVLVAVFAAGWTANGWRLGAELAELKQAQAESITKGVKDALETTTGLLAKKDRALAAAADRNRVLAVAAAAAGAESDGLRAQLTTADARIATAAESAVRDYAAAANAVLADMDREGAGMARAADGHASDVRTLLDAWPTVKEQKHGAD